MSFLKKILGGTKNDSHGQAAASSAAGADYRRAGQLIDCAGIDWNIDGQSEFLRARLTPYFDEARAKASSLGPSSDEEETNLLLHYALVTALVPTRIMQIGAGKTTLMIREALKARNIPAELIVVDPNPSIDISAAADAHLDQCAQELPLSDFIMLRANELLILDTSHIWQPGNDVDYLYTRILPQLNSGVIVGVMEIALPWEYSREELQAGFSEQPLLQMFLTNNSRIEMLYASGKSPQPHNRGHNSIWFRLR